MSGNEFVTKYLGKFGNNLPDLVQVQFESHANPGTFSGGNYTYIADNPLAVGDIVNCPTKYGDRQAQVVRTGVPIAEIPCRVGQLRHITAPAAPACDLFASFFD